MPEGTITPEILAWAESAFYKEAADNLRDDEAEACAKIAEALYVERDDRPVTPTRQEIAAAIRRRIRDRRRRAQAKEAPV